MRLGLIEEEEGGGGEEEEEEKEDTWQQLGRDAVREGEL